ncbi:MAG: hypothetical protein AMXMBFR47_04660 [Planctomycetota bacterium]
MTVRGRVRGKTIELDEMLPFPQGQAVDVDVRPLEASSLPGSPSRLLDAVRSAPHISNDDLAELESAIQSGKLPPSDRAVFDEPL